MSPDFFGAIFFELLTIKSIVVDLIFSFPAHFAPPLAGTAHGQNILWFRVTHFSARQHC
jgi:hypothetical protein